MSVEYKDMAVYKKDISAAFSECIEQYMLKEDNDVDEIIRDHAPDDGIAAILKKMIKRDFLFYIDLDNIDYAKTLLVKMVNKPSDVIINLPETDNTNAYVDMHKDDIVFALSSLRALEKTAINIIHTIATRQSTLQHVLFKLAGCDQYLEEADGEANVPA